MHFLFKDILVVKILFASGDYSIVKDSLVSSKDHKSYYETDLPLGEFQVISKWSELTEDQAKELVSDESGMDDTGGFVKVSRLESFNNLMKSNGIYLKNPIAKKDPSNKCQCLECEKLEKEHLKYEKFSGEWLILKKVL